MKKIGISFLTFMTAFAVLTTYLTPVVEAKTQDDPDVTELAEQLEFIFEKASKKDSRGEIIGFDVEMIEEKYGESPELDVLKEIQKQNDLKQSTDQLRVSPAAIVPGVRDGFIECLSDEMTSFLGSFVPTTTIAALYEELKSGKWNKAAKSLMKLTGKTAVKGGVYGLAAQLTWSYGKCMVKS